jgi:hypothetical protein
LLLVLTTLAVAGIYGTKPLIPVSRQIRSLVLLVWFWNICVFAVYGGMILWAWLVDRYGDQPPQNR